MPQRLNLTDVVLSAAATAGYHEWTTHGATHFSAHLSWTVASSGSGTMAVWATNNPLASSGTTTGWTQIDTISLDPLGAANGDKGIPFTNLSFDRVQVVYTYASGGASTITAKVYLANPEMVFENGC